MSLNKINELIKIIPDIKNYRLMTDIWDLQVGSHVKYIKKDDLTKISNIWIVKSITETTDGDHNISLENENHLVSNVLLSTVFILYKITTLDDYKQEQFELWMSKYRDDSSHT